MPFYIRKSVKLGPLRFNLSKSGIGVSAGVKGLRVGTGPRGNYVHIGAGGLYYRQTLSPKPQHRSGYDPSLPVPTASPPPTSHGPIEEITSGCVSRMTDSNAAALIAELDRKRKRLRAFPIVLIASIGIVAGLILQKITPWIAISATVVLFLGTMLAYYWDLLKKSAIVMYDLDEERIAAFQQLHERLEELSRSDGIWHITASGDVYDSKYHAGASQVVQRKRIALADQAPPFLRTNVPSFRIPAGTRSLYFLPDTVLVYTATGVGAVGYDSINLQHSTTRFIEDGSVPRDARIVDQTWRYVNKNGGPDRRFKDNRELPVCEYDELKFLTSSGLNEMLQISRTGLIRNMENAVRNMATSLEKARSTRAAMPSLPIAAESINSTSALQKTSSANGLDTSPAPSLFHPEPPAATDIHESLIRILCCAMVVDGRASSIEKERIAELMHRTGTKWSSAEVSQRVTAFIDETTTRGFKSVLSDSLSRVTSFKDIGRQGVLLRCIEALVSADGTITDAERKFFTKVQKLLV
jgi:hypothetical protein